MHLDRWSIASEVKEDYEEHTAENVQEAIERAHMAFVDWRHTAFSHHGELTKRAATVRRSTAPAASGARKLSHGDRDGDRIPHTGAWFSPDPG